MTALLCLATAIFFEARGEPYDGMIAVGQVIENRVMVDEFPDTICDVVYDKKQFSFTHDGKSDDMFDYHEPQSWVLSFIAASAVLSGGKEFVPTSTYYHSIKVDPYWADKFLYDGKIGNHAFYTEE